MHLNSLKLPKSIKCVPKLANNYLIVTKRVKKTLVFSRTFFWLTFYVVVVVSKNTQYMPMLCTVNIFLKPSPYCSVNTTELHKK